MVSAKFKRLPTDVKPLHYDIQLQPDLVGFTFTGHETIQLSVCQETSEIVLNCYQLKITAARVIGAGDNEQMPLSDAIKYNEYETDTATLLLPASLPCGEATLYLQFSGTLNDEMRGFYRSAQDVRGEGQEKEYAAVTHFEPTGARRAFPCWDEPAFKAIFSISLVAPHDKVALSNMNAISEEAFQDNLKLVKFAPTPKMSTYIIAFIVGNFEMLENTISCGDENILVRVFSTVGKQEQGKYALKVASEALSYYISYFGIPYGLPKIDLIAISDFGIGAMENWGLVTYKEKFLLVDPVESSIKFKQFVSEIIAHELAHNWFGNLVTMRWWTDLWLKEGFANFLENLCVDHLFPEYHIWKQFTAEQKIRAMDLDALDSSHPIEVPVGPPSELDEIFDSISYQKGASVIAMLFGYVGAEHFRNGVSSYLSAHQFDNTETVNFWAEMEKASGKPIGQVMSTWTKQMGFPLISVSKEIKADGKIVLKLSQQKFDVSPQSSHSGTVWHVPVNICNASSPDTSMKHVLLTGRDVLEIEVEHSEWFKLNPGESGYYRTSYSDDMLQQLTPAIVNQVLTSPDRLMIQNDLFAQVVAGLKTTASYLELVQNYASESDYSTWLNIIQNLHRIRILVEHTAIGDGLKLFEKKLISGIVAKLGFTKKDGDTHLDSMLRGSVLKVHGMCGNDVEKFKRMFQAHKEGRYQIPTDLRAAVYSTVMTNGDKNTLAELKELYHASDSPEERSRLLACMGMNPDRDIRADVLHFALTDEVRMMDTHIAVAGCTTNLEGNTQTWMFVKENWDKFKARCAGGWAMSYLIKGSTTSFATQEMLNDVKTFFTDHPVDSCKRAIDQSCETISNNILWLQRDKSALEEWFAKQGQA